MVGHKAHCPGAQTPRWWGANLTHTFAAVTQQRAAGRLDLVDGETQSPHQSSNFSTPLGPSCFKPFSIERVDMWGAKPQRGRGGSTSPSFLRGGV